MKVQKFTQKKAFSLIEIAVVLAIIGILLASVVIGKNLVDKAKIANAQALTVNSPVHALDKNLVFWHETSFGSDSYNNNNNIWFDYQQDTTKKSNTASSPTSPPTFLTEDSKLINNLPALRFTTTNSLSQPALSRLTNSFFTIFVVHTGVNDTGIFNNFTTTFTATLNQTIVDGNKRLLVFRGQNTASLTNIGSSYAGDIYEIIAFNTQLTDESRNEIIGYLKAKYKFKTNN